MVPGHGGATERAQAGHRRPRETVASSLHVCCPPDLAEVCRVPASRGPFPGCRPRHHRGGCHRSISGSRRAGGACSGSAGARSRSVEWPNDGLGCRRGARAEWRRCGGCSSRDAQRDQRAGQRSRRTWRARWPWGAGPRSVPRTRSAPRSGPAPRAGAGTGRTEPLTADRCGWAPTALSLSAGQPRAANSPNGIDKTTSALKSASRIVVRSRSRASRLSSRRRPTYAVKAPIPLEIVPRPPRAPDS